jgi:hypothetical protein
MTDPVPSKEKLPDWLRRWYALKGELRFREAADEIERLQRDLYEAEKLIAVQQERIAHEPADEALSLMRAVCQEANEYGGIAEETVQAIELYLQRAAQPPSDAPCPHPIESRATSSDGRPWCAECGGFVQ